MKKLYKSDDKKLCGVCGGLGEYFGIDPTVIRIVWLIAVLCCGFGAIAYLIAAIAMPKKPKTDEVKENVKPESKVEDVSVDTVEDKTEE